MLLLALLPGLARSYSDSSYPVNTYDPCTHAENQCAYDVNYDVCWPELMEEGEFLEMPIWEAADKALIKGVSCNGK